MKYSKAKILLPLDVYNNLKGYLRRESDYFSDYSKSYKVGDYKIDFGLKKEPSSSPKYNKIKVKISVCNKNSKNGLFFKIEEAVFSIYKVSELLLIFRITIGDNHEMLVCIDKKTPNTVEFAKSKLNIMKWNLDHKEYIKNHIYYSSFIDERELMEVCYLLIANKEFLLDNPEISDFVYTKLDYFGYIKEDNKDYNLDIFDDLSSTKEVIDKATGRVIYDIIRLGGNGKKFTGKDESRKDTESTAFNMYEQYINLLKKEGKLD